MTIKNRNDLVSDTISRILNNAPVSEILRVYSLVVQDELDKMSDEDLVMAIHNAGYMDLIGKHVDTDSDGEDEEI